MQQIRHIREAIAEDSTALKKCMEAAYAPYQKRMEGTRLPPMDTDYSSEIRNYPTWVVDGEGLIMGGLIMLFEDDWATVANIAVDPAFQGQGIGRELIDFAEQQATNNNYSDLRLATHVLLQENIALYQYFGWEEMGRDETRVFMNKKIGSRV